MRMKEMNWNKKQRKTENALRPEQHFSVKKELLGLAALFFALCVLCAGAAQVLTPKRADCGAMWQSYRKEPQDTLDVLFFGSSLVYCDVAPAVLYEETGISSFVMAGPDQTMPMTARYVRQALRTQSPQAILVEASGLLTTRSNRSVKTNITYLPWGKERIDAIFREELTQDERLGLLFPLYAYHDRWDKLTAEDFAPATADLLAGYTPLHGSSPPQKGEVLQVDEDSYEKNLADAKEILAACAEKNIRVVFFLSPVQEGLTAEQRARLREDLTQLGAELVDFNEEAELAQFDIQTDFYDKKHLNLTGARKFSQRLGALLQQLQITPGGAAPTELWQQRVERFAAEQEADR